MVVQSTHLNFCSSQVSEKEHLKSLGIDLVKELKGVGENLQDHLEVYIQWAAKKPVSLYDSLAHKAKPKIGLQWLFQRKGIGASNHFEAGGFIRSNDEVKYPNLQYHFLPLAIRYDGKAPKEGHGFQLHVGPMNTDVRGSIKITSNNLMYIRKLSLIIFLRSKKRKNGLKQYTAREN